MEGDLHRSHVLQRSIHVQTALQDQRPVEIHVALSIMYQQLSKLSGLAALFILLMFSLVWNQSQLQWLIHFNIIKYILKVYSKRIIIDWSDRRLVTIL